jgi:hypothetical protein
MLVTAAILATALLAGLPLAAHMGPRSMIVAQASALLLAVAGGSLLSTRKSFASRRIASTATSPPKFRDLASYGSTQLWQTICMNTVGLWVTAMLARSDHTLVQLGFFTVASQIRNMTGLLPGLLSQSTFPLLTNEASAPFGGVARVLNRSTYHAALLALLCASVAVAFIHGVLPLMYGRAFAGAETATIFGIATALVHMSSAPSASRLSIVSLRSTATITGIWALLVALLAWKSSPDMSAGTAMQIYFAAHSISALLGAVALWRCRSLPPATCALTAWCVLAGLMVIFLGTWRSHWNGPGVASVAIVLILPFASIIGLLVIGTKRRWIPMNPLFARWHTSVASS